MDNQKNNLSLNFSTKVDFIEKVNEEFDKVKVYVFAHGKNRNLSYVSKEELDKALPTLNYCPLVAHLFQDENGKYRIGGHDRDLVCDEDGFKLVDLTVPFGVIIENSFTYETIEEYGNEVEYITAEAYIWSGRYSDLMQTIYNDDTWFNQSVELSFKQYRPYEQDSNYTELLDINFSALCLLQKADNSDNVEPCFISACVKPIKFSLNEDFSKAMEEMKENLSSCFENIKNIKEGGIGSMSQERISEILSEYEIKLEDLDFEITEEMTEQDFKAKLDEFKVEDVAEEIIEEVVEEVKLEEVVMEVVETEITETENLDEVEETIKEIQIEETEEYKLLAEKYEIISSEFEVYKTEYSTPNAEVEELKTFKTETLAKQREIEEFELFEKFNEKLNGDTEFEALKADCSSMSIEDISDKCFAILGKKLANFSLNKSKSTSIKIPVSTDTDNELSPYGDIHQKYLKK